MCVCLGQFKSLILEMIIYHFQKKHFFRVLLNLKFDQIKIHQTFAEHFCATASVTRLSQI